jgi:serine/threonine protein kinase
MKLSRELSSLKLFGSWLGSKRTIAEGGLPLSACRVAYTLLQNATNNFSSSNLLGEGSFSHVYKANLDYGIFAAVKRLEKNGKQGENAFQAEVDLMSKIRHPNLVALLGFSSDGPEHLLVYELMHNGSLHDQLHGMLN